MERTSQPQGSESLKRKKPSQLKRMITRMKKAASEAVVVQQSPKDDCILESRLAKVEQTVEYLLKE